jgi:hypothetical protein
VSLKQEQYNYAAVIELFTAWPAAANQAQTDCSRSSRSQRGRTYFGTIWSLFEVLSLTFDQTKVLGVSTVYVDPHVEKWGLRNILRA